MSKITKNISEKWNEMKNEMKQLINLQVASVKRYYSEQIWSGNSTQPRSGPIAQPQKV